MSRWTTEFETHPFKSSLAGLVEAVETLDVDDQTVTTTVEEVARLKKATTFVNTIVANVDLELTPSSIWTNSQQQTDLCLQQTNAYKSNRNPGHLVAANNHIDNILTYIRPYMILPEQNLKALGNATKASTRLFSSQLRAFRDDAEKNRKALEEIGLRSAQYLKEIEQSSLKIKHFDQYLFEGVDDNEPAEKYFKEMVSAAKINFDAIQELHEKLLGNSDSTDKIVSDYEQKIRSIYDQLDDLKETSQLEHKQLSQFHSKIFGTQESEDSQNSEIGLEKELENRMHQLSNVEKEQLARHKAIFDKVESLLPGATSAGLASAYKALKDRFNTPIENYTKIFYGSLGALLIIGFLSITDHLKIWPLEISLIKPGDWTDMLRALLMRLPIILPVVWLAIFSAARRSQYERLQQEYAHKEAFASSYDSYKQQLRQLNIPSDDLEKELIAKAIEAVSYNASKTLDAKPSDEAPITKIVERIQLQKLLKTLDRDKASAD